MTSDTITASLPRTSATPAHPIVVLGLPKHDDAFTSTPYQLAQEWAKERTVWYVSHPYTWLDYLRNRTNPVIRRRWRATRALLTASGIIAECDTTPGLRLLYLPLILPINGLPPGRFYRLLSKINHWMVAKAIRRMLRQEGIEHYVFINSHDFYFAHLPKLLPPPRRSVYHCIDPIIKSYSARHGHYLEAQAVQVADLVVTTSPFLKRKMETYHPNTHCVPNAANFSLSQQATLPETPIYPAVAKLPGPRIGYVGNIERRIAYDWLIEIFRSQPDWHLVMVGPCDHDFIPAEFSTLSNVHLLGPVPHPQLPEVLKGFDVALIPFQRDEVSAQIYPLKLFEYLGSGKPVVTTNFNEEVTAPLRPLVACGEDATSLREAIERTLQDNDPSRRQARLRVAAENDWSARAQQFINLLTDDTPNQREG